MYNPQINNFRRVIKESIDGVSTGATTLFSCPVGANFAIDAVRFYLRDTSGYSTSPIISVGTNNPDYNNIISSLDLSSLDAIGKILLNPISSVYVPPSGADVKIKVNTAASATSYDLDVHLNGDLF